MSAHSPPLRTHTPTGSIIPRRYRPGSPGLLVHVEAGQTVGAVVAVPAGGPLWGDQRAAGLAGEGLPAGLAAVVRGGLGGGGRAPEAGGVQPEGAVRPLGERGGSGGAEGGLHPGQTLDQGGLAAPRAAQHGHSFSTQGGEKPGGRLQAGAPGQAVQLRPERLQPAGQGVSLLRGQPVPVADKEPGGQARRPGRPPAPTPGGRRREAGRGPRTRPAQNPRWRPEGRPRSRGGWGGAGRWSGGGRASDGTGRPPRISASARSPTARLSFCRSSRPDSRQGRVRPAWSTTACRFMDARHADGEKVGLVHGYLASLSRPL